MPVSTKERMPGAEWRPLPEAGRPDGYTKTQVIYHSIVGSAEGAYGYFLKSTSLESTFIVKLNGWIIQCMNASDRADANRTANYRAISVETEDNGNPDSYPWTDRQIDALVKIGVWAHEQHEVKARECPRHDASGFGYHVMFGAPGPWTPVAKTCPGIVRRKQFYKVVLPRIIAAVTAAPAPTPEEEEMKLDEVMKFAQGKDPGTDTTVGPVYLLNIEDGSREGIETADGRLGIAKLFNIDPDVHFVHPDVISQFRDKR